MRSRKSSKNQLKITSLEIMHLVNELQKFIGKRIDNVYQNSGIFLKISSKNGIEIRPDVIFVSSGFEFEKHTNFSQILRKHIKNRKIISIEQHKFDRIVIIKFNDYALISELFHNGNIILCDSSMMIISALEQRHWKDRSLVPWEKYKFPEGIDITKENEFLSGVKREEKIVSFLVKSGLGSYAESVLERCEINKLKGCKD
ncbi:MAG: NFACT family protein, partial [Candidatus Aenigmarchaeota archaeon]|nr:NFACT family protein [Candidatus Aenigmarchaeota archaeon]